MGESVFEIGNIIKLNVLADIAGVSYYRLNLYNKGIKGALKKDEKAKVKEVLTNLITKINKDLK